VSDRHYLLRVLGLSAIPRVFTFALTLISFPLMVRALGVREYGIAVFVGAVVQVLDSCVDFGVSSAAGKNLAAARESRPSAVHAEVLLWARLQAIVAVIGFGPLLTFTYLISTTSSTIDVSLRLVVISVLGLWVNVFLNFVRASLISLVTFKSLAVLDTFESVMRSAGFVVVAYFMPSAVGLASVALATGTVASVLGIALLWRLLRNVYRPIAVANTDPMRPDPSLSLGYMLKESVNFLWLRLGTRSFQSIPLIIFGRLFGSEMVGVVGAFQKVVEIANLPCAVIGNALAARSVGVVAKGAQAVQALWDAVSRFVAVSVVLAASIYLAAGILAQLLVPGSHDAATLIAILSVSVVTTAISSIVGPMSDYVGALRSRNILLTSFALIQVPVIWLAAAAFGAKGAVIAYVVVLILMNAGYLHVALRIFFPRSRYSLSFEVRYLLALLGAALTAAMLFAMLPSAEQPSIVRLYNISFAPILLLWSIVLAGLLLHRDAKAYLLSAHFFDFEFAARSAGRSIASPSGDIGPAIGRGSNPDGGGCLPQASRR